MNLQFYVRKKMPFVVWIALFILSLSGIYVIRQYGLRLDHIVIYLLSAFVFFGFVTNKLSLYVNKEVLLLLTVLFSLLLIGLVSTLFSSSSYFSIINILSSFENYFQPIALVFITVYFLRNWKGSSLSELLHNICYVYLIFLSLNVILSLLIFYIGPGDYLSFIGGSGRGDQNSMTVVERALLGGRNSGVFNQPIEGGFSYATGILIWIYLFKTNSSVLKRVSFSVLVYIMIIGGILSGSKLFYVIGAAAAIFSLLPVRNFVRLLNFKFVLTGVVIFSSFLYMVEYWPGEIPIKRGQAYFERLLVLNGDECKNASLKSNSCDREETRTTSKLQHNYSEHEEKVLELLSIYTSGRISKESVIIVKFMTIMSTSPLLGYGFGGMQTSDNAFLEVFSIGGLAGLVIYIILFLFIFFTSFSRIRSTPNETLLLISIWFVIIVGSIGAPILTANRISIVIWIFTTIILMIIGKSQKSSLQIKSYVPV